MVGAVSSPKCRFTRKGKGEKGRRELIELRFYRFSLILGRNLIRVILIVLIRRLGGN